jgi:hypothetical protein
MPRFPSSILQRAANPHPGTTERPHRYEGFNEDGSVVLSDHRGTKQCRIPDVDTKSETLSDDPLAIYKPSGARCESAL